MTQKEKPSKPRRLLCFLAGVLLGGSGIFLGQAYRMGQWLFEAPRKGLENRPAQWAELLAKPGLKNFHRVSADLYRGEQPEQEGMRQLHAMGIKTIVSLRKFHSDRDEIGDLPLGYERIPMSGVSPDDEEVVRFLKIVTDSQRLPVFVHCQHGSDRTGLMCAVYRIIVQGWEKSEAIRELREGGFGFNEKYFQSILRYLEAMDPAAMRTAAGLEPRTRTP